MFATRNTNVRPSRYRQLLKGKKPVLISQLISTSLGCSSTSATRKRPTREEKVMDIFTGLLFLALILFFSLQAFRSFAFPKCRNLPPGPRPLPVTRRPRKSITAPLSITVRISLLEAITGREPHRCWIAGYTRPHRNSPGHLRTCRELLVHFK